MSDSIESGFFKAYAQEWATLIRSAAFFAEKVATSTCKSGGNKNWRPRIGIGKLLSW